MTRRERKESRLARRKEWAEKRDQKATDAYETTDKLASQIPMGQPILVNHHSEKKHRNHLKKIDNTMRKSVESSDMAKHHRSKAAGIAEQLDNSIFSDDTDVVERLEVRIAERKAQRDQAQSS